MIKKLTLCFTTTVLLACCQTRPKENFDLLIVNASIVDVKSGEVSVGKLIGITNDTIRMVDNMDHENKFESTIKLDAENNYVMPGLWDMHVHFRGGDTLIDENKNLLPLFLAYGVTTVRDAGGDMTASVMGWQEQIKQRTLLGPNIYTSGPKLDGANPAWEGSLKVETHDDIKKAIDSLDLLGVDYVKMYDGSLTKEAFYGIIQEAEKRSLKTTGHMPLSADILKAARLGLDGSEHMYYVLKSCSPAQDSLTRLNIGFGMIETILGTYDPILARQVFLELGAQGFYVTPTNAVVKVLSDVSERDHSKDSLLAYIGEGIIKTYQNRVEGAKKARALGRRNLYQDILSLSTQYIPEMNRAGINILTGSDSGAFNSYCYPGESLIKELILLVESGLTPQQALKASIINGPHFFGLDDFYGSIAAGKVADIIVLRKNPLDDIENTKTLAKLIKGGKVYDIKEIHAILKSLNDQN